MASNRIPLEKLEILTEAYNQYKYPTAEAKQDLANRLDLQVKQVEVINFFKINTRKIKFYFL